MDADVQAAFAVLNQKLDALAAGQAGVAHNVRETLAQELLLMNNVQGLQTALAQIDTDTTTIAAGLATETASLTAIQGKLDAESTKLDGVAQQIGGVGTLVQQLRDQLAQQGQIPQSVFDTLTAIEGRTSAAVSAIAASSNTLTSQSSEIDMTNGKIDAAASALQAIATPPPPPPVTATTPGA
jgi:chromosome segregation ATPase